MPWKRWGISQAVEEVEQREADVGDDGHGTELGADAVLRGGVSRDHQGGADGGADGEGVAAGLQRERAVVEAQVGAVEEQLVGEVGGAGRGADPGGGGEEGAVADCGVQLQGAAHAVAAGAALLVLAFDGDAAGEVAGAEGSEYGRSCSSAAEKRSERRWRGRNQNPESGSMVPQVAPSLTDWMPPRRSGVWPVARESRRTVQSGSSAGRFGPAVAAAERRAAASVMQDVRRILARGVSRGALARLAALIRKEWISRIEARD